MPRLRNVRTGVVVSVPEEKVARLGSDFEPVDRPVEKPAVTPAPRKPRNK